MSALDRPILFLLIAFQAVQAVVLVRWMATTPSVAAVFYFALVHPALVATVAYFALKKARWAFWTLAVLSALEIATEALAMLARSKAGHSDPGSPLLRSVVPAIVLVWLACRVLLRTRVRS
jgi:hypothetical protein